MLCVPLRKKTEKTGAKFKGIKNLDNSRDSKFSSFKEILELIFNTKEKFDYIIYDSNFIIGNEVGRVLKIPTICSITTFASNESVAIFDVFKHVSTKIQPPLTNSVLYNTTTEC